MITSEVLTIQTGHMNYFFVNSSHHSVPTPLDVEMQQTNDEVYPRRPKYLGVYFGGGFPCCCLRFPQRREHPQHVQPSQLGGASGSYTVCTSGEVVYSE